MLLDAVVYCFTDVDTLINSLEVLQKFEKDFKNLTTELNKTDDPKELEDIRQQLNEVYKEIAEKKEHFQELKEVYEKDNNGNFEDELKALISKYK